MTNRTLNLTDPLYDYLLSVSPPEPPLLRRLRAETAPLAMARMQIAPEQGQFLGLLARLVGARQAIEVGVFTGYSSLCVAQALPEDGRLVACDVSEEWTAMARRYWAEAGVADRVDLRLAPASDTLQQLLDEGEANRFDFAFIDAHKPEYQDYYERCLSLLRPGGLVAVDNVLWSGRVIDPAQQDEDTVAIRAFNERLASDDRVHLCVVPIGDGLTLARKKN
jgi:predicted O-methyltransferase YrrM